MNIIAPFDVYFDPQDKLGKFCPTCGREHFNEGEFCTRCLERMTPDADYDYE